MIRLTAVLILCFSPIWSSCARPDVKYSNLIPRTTATVASDKVTIHLGSNVYASACWTRTKTRIEDGTVYVVGYNTMAERSREFVVQLPKAISSKGVAVVWIDPDGRHVPIPITK